MAIELTAAEVRALLRAVRMAHPVACPACGARTLFLDLTPPFSAIRCRCCDAMVSIDAQRAGAR